MNLFDYYKNPIDFLPHLTPKISVVFLLVYSINIYKANKKITLDF